MRKIPECQSVEAELTQMAASDQFAFSPKARRHLAECRRCRDLATWMREPVAVPMIAPDTARRIAVRLTSSIESVRPLPGPRWVALWIWGTFALLAAGLASTFVAYSNSRTGVQIMSTAQRIAMVANIAGVAAILAVLLAWQMVPASSRRFPAKIAAVLAGLGLVAMISLLFPWKLLNPFSQSLMQLGWKCSLRETTLAIPAAGILWLLALRGAVTQPSAVGGVVGALAGLVGFTAVQFRCPFQDAMHLLVWHVGPVAIASFVGIWFGNLSRRFFVREK